MFPSTIAAALLLLDSNDSDSELDSENELNHLHHHEHDDSDELSIIATDDVDTMDTSTIDSSDDTDGLEVSNTTNDNVSIGDNGNDNDDYENFDNDESNEESIEPEPKRFKPDNTLQKSESDCVDPSQKCPICLGAWTSAGDHRLCALRCGHLFGYKCITQWLSSNNRSSKRCPQCNTKASIRHIRFLYATKLTSSDHTEVENMKKKLEEAHDRESKMIKALNKEKRRVKKYKQMYKDRSLALAADSDFCVSD